MYRGLVEDVTGREAALSEDVPVADTARLDGYLERVVEDWESERKSLRTVPVCNAYEATVEGSVSDSMIRTLTALDASVNVLDDIIDTSELAVESRIALTVNAAFSSVLLAENCPPRYREEVGDLLRDYFTALFQIPLVERELLEEMREAEERETNRRAARQIYSYRARDIDAFARLPAVVLDLDSATERRLVGDLRAYRARRLLFKDIQDVSRDIADGDTTPVLHLLRRHDSVEAVAEAVERILSEFAYSATGDAQYGSLLVRLESSPEDLSAALHASQEIVADRG